jgi:DNA-binding MarR family transcriptional regulator
MANRGQLVEDILDQLPMMTGDVDELTGATASFVNLNRTDFRALQALSSSQGMTAGELARALRVTTGATTRVIDSLVAAGHAHREWDPEDRRRILVSLTPTAQRTLDRALQALREDLRKSLSGYSESELDAVLRFVGSLRGLARTHARRLARPAS